MLGDGRRLYRVARRILGLARRVGIQVSCFRIFAISLDGPGRVEASLPRGYRFSELTPGDVSACPFPELRECDWYGGSGSHGFGILRDDGVLVCAQWLWFGERYQQRSFWPLEAHEAASMQLVSAASERGKGLATQIKVHSAERMRAKGFSRLYSKIWWTNTSSIRVSEKAGWRNVGTILEISLPARSRPVRVVRRRGRHDRDGNRQRCSRFASAPTDGPRASGPDGGP